MSDQFRKLTQDELATEARERFGDDTAKWSFVCPHCGDVASVQDFVDAGDGNRVGQECIGRLRGALKRGTKASRDGIVRGERGCDWAAYGLFRGPWEIVLPAEGDKPERSAWSFALAGGDPR